MGYWETTCVIRVEADDRADARRRLSAFVQFEKDHADPVYFLSWAEPYPAAPPEYVESEAG